VYAERTTVDIQNLSHTLAEGDRIVNANAALGSVRGRILHIATLAELPALDGRYWAEMKAATIRRILAEWCVELVALIGYHYGRPAARVNVFETLRNIIY
jgi:hypothetical protein